MGNRAGPGWKLLVIASEANTLAHVNEQKEQFLVIGLAMLAVLIVFYVGFFIVLNVRARAGCEQQSRRTARNTRCSDYQNRRGRLPP